MMCNTKDITLYSALHGIAVQVSAVQRCGVQRSNCTILSATLGGVKASPSCSICFSPPLQQCNCAIVQQSPQRTVYCTICIAPCGLCNVSLLWGQGSHIIMQYAVHCALHHVECVLWGQGLHIMQYAVHCALHSVECAMPACSEDKGCILLCNRQYIVHCTMDMECVLWGQGLHIMQ